MNFNRRDLLKYFSAGTAIIPTLNGMPVDTDAEAIIVKPPEVELIDRKIVTASASDAFRGDGGMIVEIAAFVRTKNGAVRRIQANGIRIDYARTPQARYRGMAPEGSGTAITFQIVGDVQTDTRGGGR